MKNLVNQNLDEYLFEAKKGRKKGPGKNPKFRKVMREFGKGELKSYHGKKPLKPKEEGGTKKELAQAKAIAYSEAGLSKK
jgi:hypothetical protein